MASSVDTLPLTISIAHDLLQRRRLCPSELMALQIARIEKIEPTIRAWACLDLDGAVRQARALDERWARGFALPEMFAIPYGAKDIFETQAFPTAAGSAVLAGWQPTTNATVIDKLEAAGAILVGKTTATEFAQIGGLPPQTRNPWKDADHTPGGSSNGSAAAVAAGMAMFALGTQTAGSLSRPAGYCGLTSLKASFGRVSKAGVIPAAWTLDHVGAMTRGVEDAVCVFNAIAGPDANDPFSSAVPMERLKARSRTQHRIGHVRHRWFDDALRPDVGDAVRTALDLLSRHGAMVSDIAFPEELEAAAAAHITIMHAEAAAVHRDWLRSRRALYHPPLAEFLERGHAIPAVDYLLAQQTRLRYRDVVGRLFDDVDLLVTPTSPTTAPVGLEQTGSPAFNLPFTSMGLPTLVLPIGFDAEGLPISMQLVAPLYAEQRLVDIGLAYQQLTDWHLRRPLPRLAA